MPDMSGATQQLNIAKIKSIKMLQNKSKMLCRKFSVKIAFNLLLKFKLIRDNSIFTLYLHS